MRRHALSTLLRSSLACALLLVGCGPAVVGGGIAGGVIGSDSGAGSQTVLPPPISTVFGAQGATIMGGSQVSISWNITVTFGLGGGAVDLLISPVNDPSTTYPVALGVPDVQSFYNWDPTTTPIPDGVYVLRLEHTDVNGTLHPPISDHPFLDPLAPLPFELKLLFAESQQLGSVASPGLALVDVDGDLDLDILTGNQAGQANVIWTNDGTGMFTDSGLTFGTPAQNTLEVVAGDIDGDLDADLVLGEGLIPTQQVSFHLNDGAGNFTNSATILMPGEFPGALRLGDVDGDTDLDLLVSTLDEVLLYTNDGAGNFTNSGQSISPGSDGTVSALVLADVDGDTDLDLVVPHYSGSAPEEVWLNDGAGTFSFFSSFNPIVQNTFAMDGGDIDGDGDLDIFLAGNENRIWLNDGTGQFTEGALISTGSAAVVAVRDVDGDGFRDLLQGTAAGLELFLNQQDGTFANPVFYLTPNILDGVAFGDLDADGEVDVATACRAANPVFLSR